MSRFLVGTVAAFVVVVLGGCGAEYEPTGPELGASFCGWLGRCHPVQEFDLDACVASYADVRLTSPEGVSECIDALDGDACPLDGLPPACRRL